MNGRCDFGTILQINSMDEYNLAKSSLKEWNVFFCYQITYRKNV